MVDENENEEMTIAVGEGHEPVTARDLLSELEEAGREMQIGNRLEYAQRNERWVHGEQYSESDIIDDETDTARFGVMSDVPQQYRNLLRGPWLAYTAMVLEEMPICMVYPSNATGIDVTLADVSNKILDYADERNDAQDLWDNAVGLAQLHGTDAIKTTFDPTRDARGGMEPGDVRYSVETILEYWRDPTGDVDEARWVVFRTHVPKHVGVALALANGLDDSYAKESRLSSDGEATDPRFCEVTEVWWRPDGEHGRFPDGLYLTFLGDELLTADAFPYEHGELPISEIMITRRRGSPYATSHVDDAIMPQRIYNEAVSIQSKLARDFRNTYRFTTPDVEQKIEEGNNETFGVSPDVLSGGNPMIYVSPPPPSQLLQHEEDRARDHVYDAFGQSESLMGSAEIEGRGPAGKTVAYYQWLRRQALGGVIKSVHKALRRLARQTIRLFQQYASDELILSIIGEHRYVDLVLFRQADLRHIEASLKLEPSATSSRLRAEQAAYAAEQAAAGAMDPARAGEVQRTGLASTLSEESAAASIQALVRVALSGSPVQPDPNVPPAIAVAELERLASVYAQEPNAEIIEQILAWYRSQMTAPTANAQGQAETNALMPGGAPAPPTASTMGAPST